MDKFISSLKWWESGVIVGLLVCSWLGSWLLNKYLLSRIQKLKRNEISALGVSVTKAFVPLFRWGLFIAAIAALLHMSDISPSIKTWMDRMLYSTLALLTAYVVSSAVSVALRFWAARAKGKSVLRTRATVSPILAKACTVFFFIIAILLILQNLGFNVGGLMAGLGLGGLAVALAGKETLANFFGSIAVLIDRPFQVGDVIQQGSTEGTVEKIGLRSTWLRTGDGFLVSIPNQIVATTAVVNVSSRMARRHIFKLGMVYGLSADQMREAVDIVRGIFAAHEQTHDAWVYWKDFSDSSLDIQVIYWSRAEGMKDFLVALQELNLAIKGKLDAAGLDMAFPTRTIILEHDEHSLLPAKQSR